MVRPVGHSATVSPSEVNEGLYLCFKFVKCFLFLQKNFFCLLSIHYSYFYSGILKKHQVKLASVEPWCSGFQCYKNTDAKNIACVL